MKKNICILFSFVILLVSAVDAADDWVQKYPDPKTVGSRRPCHGLHR